MADTSIAITAGSGTSVDTRTESTNGNHRQVVVLGDPSDNSGVAPVDSVNGLSVNITNGSIAVTGAFTEYQEDSASDADPTGLVNMLVRADTPTSVTSTDGDNVAQRGTNYGAGYVQVVTSGGAFVDTFGGGTQYTEGDTDATITGNAMLMEGAANALVPVQGTAADGLLVNLGANNDITGTVTANLSATDNAVLDQIELNQDSQTAILTTIDADTGGILTAVQLIDNAISGNEMQVDVVAALPAGTNNIGDVDVLSLVPGTAATSLGKARDSAIGATDTGVAMLGVRRDSPTAETPIAGDYIVPQYSANGEAWVRTQGELADDAAFTIGTTRVQPVGYLADSTSTDSVDEGDIGAARMTLDRKQIIQPYADPVSFVSGAITTSMTATTSTSLVAAPGAGLRNYLTTIIVSNAHGTVGTDVVIQDGSGGTTLMTIPAAAVYGGAVITLPTPLRQPTTNTAIFCANVTTGASTKVSAVGYTAA